MLWMVLLSVCVAVCNGGVADAVVAAAVSVVAAAEDNSNRKSAKNKIYHKQSQL